MDGEEEDLADVAYGLFEILLNRELKGRGAYLFERVELDEDFFADFEEIYSLFAADYPQLASSLEERFGGCATVYGMIREGEGVSPTKTTRTFWIVQDAPGFDPAGLDDEKIGKWLIFQERDTADDLWAKVRNLTCAGELGISAKVSTVKPSPDARDERIVIYVHTRDWEDEEDVMRVREKLRSLGVEQRIGYKRNIETYLGEYSEKGKKVTYYSV